MLSIAPPLTPPLDIEQLRIVLMSSLLSRQRREPLVLRIDDRDPQSSEGYTEEELRELLKKFAVEPEHHFYQSEQRSRHQRFAVQLLEQGDAYLCTCGLSGEEGAPTEYCEGSCIQEQKKRSVEIKTGNLPYAIRIKPPAEPLVWQDTVLGERRVSTEVLDGFLLLDHRGIPSADLAAACDDMLWGISVLIRPQSACQSTARQIHIQRSLGYKAEISYAHLPPISAAGEASPPAVTALLAEGFLPDAIINCLLQLGTKRPVERFTLPEALEWFALSSYRAQPAVCEMEMLRRLNRLHLEAMDPVALSGIAGFADADIGRVLKLCLRERWSLEDLRQCIAQIFSPKACDDQMCRIAALIRQAPMLDDYSAFLRYLSQHSGLDKPNLLQPLRQLMTGTLSGLEPEEIYPLIKPYITEIARCKSC